MRYRKFIRLPGYDYSKAGGYFVTICTANRVCLFGAVEDGAMVPNDIGKIIAEEWGRTAEIREEIHLGTFQVMPNHLHGIVFIVDLEDSDQPKAPKRLRAANSQRPRGPIPRSLAALIGGFKSSATKRIRIAKNAPDLRIWQPNYYEHIIRNEADHDRIARYMLDNPARWAMDNENPNRLPGPADDANLHQTLA